jgi:hypothetical protein
VCRSPEPGRVSYRTRVDEPDQRLASIRARHVKMTRYFRAFALTASTADLMAMSLRFAEHYDRLVPLHGDFDRLTVPPPGRSMPLTATQSPFCEWDRLTRAGAAPHRLW